MNSELLEYRGAESRNDVTHYYILTGVLMVTCALIGVQTDRGSDAQQCVYVGILIACTAFLGNTIFSAMNIIMRNNFIGNEKWTFGHILFHLLAAAVTVLIFVAVCKLLQSTD